MSRREEFNLFNELYEGEAQQRLPMDLPAKMLRTYPWPALNEGGEAKYRRENPDAGRNAHAQEHESLVQRVREGRPSIRIPEHAVPGIAAEGRFLSQHATGTSEGMYDPEYRAETEREMFGYRQGRGGTGHARPIYGYWGKPGDPDEPMVGNYGPVKAVLKPEVAHRTTVTFGDSLGADLTPFHVPDVQEHGVDPQRATHYSSPSYVEAQFHGGLSADDIDHLEYTLRRQHLSGKMGGPHMDRPLLEHSEELGKPYRILQQEEYTQKPLAPRDENEERTGPYKSKDFWESHFGLYNKPPHMISQQFREIERSPGFKSQWGI